METKRIIAQWHFDPLIVVMIITIILLYLTVFRQQTKGKSVFLIAAVLFLIIAECSPLHYLGMHYYFSAHMVSHVILLLVCGPLLVMSLPAELPPRTQKIVEALSSFSFQYSWTAWLCGVGIMWFWHIPSVFDASFTSMQASFSVIPVLHAGSMLIAGMLFSWPLFGPLPRYHIHAGTGIVYLFTACISCSVLGLLITFAPLGTYHHYAAMQGMNNPFSLSQQDDQQAAGLIMWVPCCFVYLSGCIYLLWRWFSESTTDTTESYININSIDKHE